MLWQELFSARIATLKKYSAVIYFYFFIHDIIKNGET